MFIYIHIHIYTHVYKKSLLHLLPSPHTQTLLSRILSTPTHTHTHTHKHKHTYTHRLCCHEHCPHKHTHTHTYIHTHRLCCHAHCPHQHAHTHTHTNTNTHTHTDSAVMNIVRRCARLRELGVVGCRLGDQSAEGIAALRTLRALCVEIDVTPQTLTDHGRAVLYSLPESVGTCVCVVCVMCVVCVYNVYSILLLTILLLMYTTLFY